MKTFGSGSIAAISLIAALSVASFALPKNSSAEPSDPGVSGKWSGSFDITSSDGRVQHDTAWLNLKQEANTLTGTAGPSEEKQSEIKAGKVNGQEIQFNVEVSKGGKPLAFRLHLEGDHLKGEASGDMPDGPVKVAIDVTRVKAQSRVGPPSAQDLHAEISRMD